MRRYRRKKLDTLLRNELSRIVAREIFVKGAVVTVTRVEVNDAMDFARAYVSVFPPEKKKEAMGEIAKHRGLILRFLGRKITMRGLPKTTFVYDAGQENAAQVEKALMDDNIK